ncbi:MAG: 2-succinyl-5-enolpyruvyl-6-hydroxy-3-cyclohexene-1-carboxylic-acid synthase [Actinobacteria bacterium]|nr:2-succinyl-5-enolpyruvyl-6-hydroxy-3-cyclohexene-1-carboxylic-acid synthase [Actinomycetota bacterium]
MKLTNETFAPLRVLIDELARSGVRHAVVCPGSRNAPLAYVLGDRDDVKCWSVLDERSAGFFALGIAKSTGAPVVVTCSSGTAAANLHPAVIEADHAGVPLIVLTADRPPELRDVGAGQAIDQIKLYGSSVRWFVEGGNHALSEQTLRHFRALGCRAVAEATGANPGPVHINLPLREPLAPEEVDLSALEAGVAARGRPAGEAWTKPLTGTSAVAEDSFGRLLASRRPLMVVGEQNHQDLAATIAEFAARHDVPVLADALSQMRRTGIAERASLVCAYDAILRNAAAREYLEPDYVLRLGELPTSKPLRSWLASLDCPQVAIDPRGVWHEATRVATELVQCDPNVFVRAGLDRSSRATSDSWSEAWRALESAAQDSIDSALATERFPFEPAVYRSVLSGLRGGATIWVSSSMPVRDVEAYVSPARDDVRFLSNRGANGIDGVLSSALGAKAPWGCDHVILLTGDLALLYDINALAVAARHEIPITIVCVDNDGGGIFSFLPIAKHPGHFEDKIAAPSGVDLESVVKAFGAEYSAPENVEQLQSAAMRSGVVHLRTSRTDNKNGHDRVLSAVDEAIGVALAKVTALP